MSEVKGDGLLKGVLASLQAKFSLSDAYLALLRKDLEDIADQNKDEQARTIKQVEEEISGSVSSTPPTHLTPKQLPTLYYTILAPPSTSHTL